MQANTVSLFRSAAFLVVVCSLLGFGSSAYQSVLAHQLAAASSVSYRPDAQQQAIAEILRPLPSGEADSRVAFLTKSLGSLAEDQYTALPAAADLHASHTLNQTLIWAAVSLLAGIALLELRRERAGAVLP